jgi:hypothetical protein
LRRLLFTYVDMSKLLVNDLKSKNSTLEKRPTYTMFFLCFTIMLAIFGTYEFYLR